MGLGVPLLNPTAAEDGVFPKAKKGLGHIAALHPGCHGGDAVLHLPEHAPPVHTVEGVGKVKEALFRMDIGILLHMSHIMYDSFTTHQDSNTDL